MKSLYIFLFLFFCHLQCKDVSLELEGEYPDKLKLILEYTDDLKTFSVDELRNGVDRYSVCDVILYTNIRHPVQLCISDRTSKGDFFYLVDKDHTKKVPFTLFKSMDHSFVENGGVIFAQYNFDEPIDIVVSLGVNIPSMDQYQGLGNRLSSKFTVTLKHIG